MFLLICKLYICIQNVFGHIFYRSQLHLYMQFWQFEVQKLAYMLILAAGGSSPYLSSVRGYPPFLKIINFFNEKTNKYVKNAMKHEKTKNKLGLSWAKLSCQLGFGCTVINICCLILINMK